MWARLLVEAGFLAHLLYMLPKDLRVGILKVEWNSSLLNHLFVILLSASKVGLCLRGVFFFFLFSIKFKIVLSKFLVIAYANVRKLALNISQFHGYD